MGNQSIVALHWHEFRQFWEKKLSEHPLLKLYKQSWDILFNKFAKNEAKKYNSKVYAAKKRQPGAAGDAANRKIKKLQSNSRNRINKMLPKS